MEKQQKVGIIYSYKMLWRFMGKRERFTFVSIFVMSIITALTRAYTPMIPALIIAKLTSEKYLIFGLIDLSSIPTIPYIIVVCMIAVVLWIFGMINYRMIDIFARKMMCIVNEKSQEIILLERKNLDLGLTIGEINYIIKSAVDNIYNLIEPFCWNLIGNILSVIFMTAQIFTISWVAGLVEIGLVLVILLCVFIRTKVQKGVVDQIEVQNAKIGNHFLMSLNNIAMITMLKSKDKELKELKKLNDSYYKEHVKRADIGFWYWVIVISIEYIGLGCIVLAFYMTAPRVAILASIATLISMMNEIYMMIEGWGYLINDLQTSATKLCNLLKIYPKDSNLKKESARIDKKIVDLKINKLQVNNYLVKINNFEKQYNQTFNSGLVYVLSGASGQGKTTLINAICGLREIGSGNLTINDKYTIKNMYDYRDKISYLFQDSMLFDRTLKENIAYPNDELNDKALELIDTFDMKKIVNRDRTNNSLALTLSGGEKKRIDIIRTLSKEADIYIFDEPTNELDSKNVDIVLNEIKEKAKENKIVIVVSHDKHCLSIADEIIKL